MRKRERERGAGITQKNKQKKNRRIGRMALGILTHKYKMMLSKEESIKQTSFGDISYQIRRNQCN